MDKAPRIWFLKIRTQRLVKFNVDSVELRVSPVCDYKRLDTNFCLQPHQSGIIDVHVDITVRKEKKKLFATLRILAENIYKQYPDKPYWRLDDKLFRDDFDTTVAMFRGSTLGNEMRRLSLERR